MKHASAITTFAVVLSTMVRASNAMPTTPTGRLVLASGSGRHGVAWRGVEIVATTRASPQITRRSWLLFDATGHFEHSLPGEILRVRMATGLREPLVVFPHEDLPSADAEGWIDLGTIDLRTKLRNHRMQ